MKSMLNSLLAFSLLGIGSINALFILFVIGQIAPSKYPKFFLWAHRISGYAFFALYIGICIIMFQKLEQLNGLPPKAAIHAYIGIAIFPLILAKICIVRLYKKFYKSLPIYGMFVLIAVYLQVPLYAGLYIIFAIKSQNIALLEKGRLVRVNVNTGRGIVQQRCSTCHSLERVYAYAKTEAGWRDYVSRMRAKDPSIMSDQEALEALGYLVKNLGIDETRMDLQVGMKIIIEKCHTCHSVERVFTSRKTPEEWVKTIELMRSFDPLLLNDSEARQVNYYVNKVLMIQDRESREQKTD